MDPSSFSLIEMLIPFGLLLAFCVWQLYSVSQAKKRRLAREEAEKTES